MYVKKRKLFEKIFPPPSYIKWNGKKYVGGEQAEVWNSKIVVWTKGLKEGERFNKENSAKELENMADEIESKSIASIHEHGAIMAASWCRKKAINIKDSIKNKTIFKEKK